MVGGEGYAEEDDMENEGVGNEEIDRFMGWKTIDLRDEKLGSERPRGKEGRWKRGPEERGGIGGGMRARQRERDNKYAKVRDGSHETS